MAAPGAITGVVAHAQRRIRCEIATRAGASVIDRAANRLSDLAVKRHAARRALVGAAHAHQRRRQRDGHLQRNARVIGGSQVGTMKIDAEGGAAGAATLAGKIGHGRTPA